MTRVLTGVTTLVPSREEPRASRSGSRAPRPGASALPSPPSWRCSVVGRVCRPGFLPDTWATLCGHMRARRQRRQRRRTPAECGSESVLGRDRGEERRRVRPRQGEEQGGGRDRRPEPLRAAAWAPPAAACSASSRRQECWALAERATNRHNWRAAPATRSTRPGRSPPATASAISASAGSTSHSAPTAANASAVWTDGDFPRFRCGWTTGRTRIRPGCACVRHALSIACIATAGGAQRKRSARVSWAPDMRAWAYGSTPWRELRAIC